VLGHAELINTYLSQIDAMTPDDLMEIYHRHIEDRSFFTTMVEPESALS
jgi:hypothetical protein